MTDLRQPHSSDGRQDGGGARSGRALRRLLSEPLLHFALIGAALFLAYQVMGGDSGVESNRIVIDDAIVGELVLQHTRTWQRPPTPAEMKAMLDNYVREEVLYRQGVAMGLDQGDAAIRRRVLQKLDVIAEESQQADQPDDEELNRFLAAHRANYASPARLTFEQIYFDPSSHGPAVEQAMQSALAALAKGGDPAQFGDASLLPRHYENQPADSLARDFGEEFPAALARHDPGKWFGPVRSGLGLHLIRIEKRVDGKAASLQDVRPAVLRDWEAARRKRASQAYYDGLKGDYAIVIDATALPDEAIPDGARH